MKRYTNKRQGPSSNKPVRSQPSMWRPWFWWMAATALGFSLGSLAMILGHQSADALLWPQGRTLLGGIAFGLSAGICQWLVLRRMVANAGGWVIASALGSASGFMILDLQSSDLLFPLSAMFIGTIVGVAQWAVLREQSSRAGYWIMTTVLSAVLIAVAPVLIMGGVVIGIDPGSPSVILLSLTVGLACLLLSAALQGGTLVWLLQPSQLKQR